MGELHPRDAGPGALSLRHRQPPSGLLTSRKEAPVWLQDTRQMSDVRGLLPVSPSHPQSPGGCWQGAVGP